MAGRRIENSINRNWIISLADNAGNTQDTTGSAQGYAALIAAMRECEIDGYTPDTVVLAPGAAYKLRSELIPSAVYQESESVKTGSIPSLGLKYYVCGISTAAVAGMSAGSNTWAYAADNNVGMLIMDAFSGSCIGERAGIQVEEFKEPIRDLVGAKVTWRGCPSYLQADAVCKVMY